MRLLSLTVVGLVVLLPASLVHAHRSVEITDAASDPTVSVMSPKVGITDPSIDMLAVDFSRANEDLVVEIRLSDLGAGPDYPFEVQRVWTVYFDSDFHDLIVATGVDREHRSPSLLLTCQQGSATTCVLRSEERIEIDSTMDLVRFKLPLDILRGKVIGPRASSHLDFVGCPCPDMYPNLGVQDIAPNGRRGFDFDPYAT